MAAISARSKLLLPLIVWTLLVWTSRLRNIWSDDDLSTSGQIVRTLVAVVFIVFGGVTAIRLWQCRGRALEPGDRRFAKAFVVWTISFWVIRGVGIILDDHSFGFTAIHTVLMVISIGLAMLAWRAVSDRSISSSLVAAR